MSRNDALWKRVTHLEKRIIPLQSLASRIEKLSPEDRSQYETWRKHLTAWLSRFDTPASSYEAYLRDEAPTIATHVADALSRKAPRVEVGMTIVAVSRLWEDFKDQQ